MQNIKSVQTAKARYSVQAWEEKNKEGKTLEELYGSRAFTHSHVQYQFQGEMQGDTASQSLMFYSTDGTSKYVGIEEFVGELAGKKGSFVFQTEGEYRENVASTSYRIIPNSGTGELEGIRGEAKTSADGQQTDYPFELSYWFENES